MKSFDLLKNYLDDSEVLLRNTRVKLKKVLMVVSEDSQIRRSLTLEFEAIANKSLREFSAPTIANIRTRPEVNVGDNGFELKPTLITMVQANHFLEICSTFTIKGVNRDAILTLIVKLG
jgi:hypothetical protein